jgi:hypothetical protein
MSEIVGQRMSDYTKLNELTQAEQETYLANAAVTTYGKTSDDGNNTNVNVPLSAIKPDVPVTDVTVGGTSVVSNGVAAVPTIPTAESLADDGLHAVNGKLEIDYDTSLTIVTVGYLSDDRRKLSVANPVPPAGGKAGKFLTVQHDPDTQSDEIVWGTVTGLPDTTGHSQGDVLAIGVSGPDWTAPVHIPVIGTINISPAPSYNYIILQNFLDGHTIGTPISDSDHSDFYNKYPADIGTLWYNAEDWSDTNLVSTTPGAKLLYSENGFDFSKYGLPAGQIPFGFCKCYDIYDGAGYANITLPSEWTLESWFYSPLGSGDPFWGSFFDIGPSYPNLIRLYVDTNSISLFAMDNEVLDVSKTVTNQAWHHVALSCDGTNLYTFYDGELIGTVAIASVSGLSAMLASAVKVMVNVDANGNGSNTLWYSQLALCDSCKWTDDFTPSKEAY